jgi:plastocyanin
VIAVRSAACIAVLALAASASPANAGTLKGQVELLQKGGRKGGDLSDVVVWVEGAKGRPKPGTAVMTMKGKAFRPRVVAVGVGGTVEFPNDDPIFHNVFSVSGDNRFDLELYKRPKSGRHTFQNPGVVRVYCNIHPQMSAVVVVRDSPFFALAQEDGTFSIPDVPAGRYVVKAWHERAAQEASAEVVVPESGDAGAKLVLDASAFKRVQHKKKDGKSYGSDEKY